MFLCEVFDAVVRETVIGPKGRTMTTFVKASRLSIDMHITAWRLLQKMLRQVGRNN